MEFMIFNWYSDDRERYSEADLIINPNLVPELNYNIYLFGVNREGKSVSLVVEKFKPYFYVKCPEEWTNRKIDLFIEFMKNTQYFYHNKKKEYYTVKEFKVKKKDGYGFTNSKEFKFVRFSFTSLKVYKKLKYKIKEIINLSPTPKPKENKYTKKLRQFSGVSLYNSNIDPMLTFMHIKDISASGWIYIPELKKNNLCHADLNYKIVWSKIISKKEINEIPPVKMLSFDIECYSSTGEFPQASNVKDKIIQIGSSIQRFGEEKSDKNVFVLGECDEIEDTNVIVCENEKDLIHKWFVHIHELNPDVIIGYNIHGFDWEYISERCKLLELLSYKKLLSRIEGVYSTQKEYKMESNAYGQNLFNYMDTPGINQIDLLYYFRREVKLSSYKLDFVAKHFLNENKRPVTPQQIFKMGGPEGDSKSRSIVADYCAQDTLLPLRLLENRLILTNLIEMSKCTHVPLVWLIFRGQQIKVYSQVQKELRLKGYLFPEHLKFNKISSEKFQGATVLNCERGAHLKHPVSGLDFKSLYPSIIIAHNLCVTTLVLEDKYDNLPGVEYDTHEWDSYKFRVVKNRKGIISDIMERLWNERKSVKKQMKQEKDNRLKNILDAKQLAIKVSMNSIYGVFGAQRGYLSMKPIAMIVTYTGRKMIEHSRECAEKYYNGSDECDNIKAHVVYGDSVTGDMPVTIKKDGKIDCRNISELNCSEWKRYKNKEMSLLDQSSLIWTGSGWSKGIRIIRHKINTKHKKIYRVVTPKGIVYCTEDHSLFSNKVPGILSEISPKNLRVGDSIFHKFIS